MEIASIVVAVAALFVSGTTVIYVERKTGQRELAQWKRTELIQAISELMQLSSTRQAELHREYELLTSLISPGLPEPTLGSIDETSSTAMIVIAERIKLIDDACGEAAQRLVDAHEAAIANALFDSTPHRVEAIELLLIAPNDLKRLHRELANAFRAALGLSR